MCIAICAFAASFSKLARDNIVYDDTKCVKKKDIHLNCFVIKIKKNKKFRKRTTQTNLKVNPFQKMAVNMLNNTQTDTDANEINFTAFTDLCRFCSLRHGAKINLFEKEAEQRQILYKVRSFLPIAVNCHHCLFVVFFFLVILPSLCCLVSMVNLYIQLKFVDIKRRFSSEENLRTMHFTAGTILRMESNLCAK